jgi:L-2-hydroxyglutarate oxidase LhgO
MAERFDVIVIGSGSAGSLCAALLRRYTPTIRVAFIERRHLVERTARGLSNVATEVHLA